MESLANTCYCCFFSVALTTFVNRQDLLSCLVLAVHLNHTISKESSFRLFFFTLTFSFKTRRLWNFLLILLHAYECEFSLHMTLRTESEKSKSSCNGCYSLINITTVYTCLSDVWASSEAGGVNVKSNRPIPSCLLPLYQNESKCESEFRTQVHFYANQT